MGTDQPEEPPQRDEIPLGELERELAFRTFWQWLKASARVYARKLDAEMDEFRSRRRRQARRKRERLR